MDEGVFGESLFTVPRLVLVVFVAFTASLLDMHVLHVLGIETYAEVLVYTAIHAVGLYLGFTIVAYYT